MKSNDRCFLKQVKIIENGIEVDKIRFKWEETNYYQDLKYKYFDNMDEARSYCKENNIIIIE